MNTDMMPGLFFGMALFFALAMVAMQMLPPPLSVSWPMFLKGACLAFLLATSMVMLIAVFVYLSMKIFPPGASP